MGRKCFKFIMLTHCTRIYIDIYIYIFFLFCVFVFVCVCVCFCFFFYFFILFFFFYFYFIFFFFFFLDRYYAHFSSEILTVQIQTTLFIPILETMTTFVILTI